MCDARLWSELALPYDAIEADLDRSASVEGMARAALARAPDAFVAMGFSMGGIVALQLARVAGSRLRGLILVDTNAGADTPERRLMRERQQAAVRAGLLAQIVSEELKPNYFAACNRGRADLLKLTMDMALSGGPSVFLNQAEALKTRPDAWDSLADIDVPVLLLCGAEDELCPPALHERMLAKCRDGELVVVAGAGHLLPLEQPEAMSRAIVEWADRRGLGETHG